jgi:hypothetical protein
MRRTRKKQTKLTGICVRATCVSLALLIGEMGWSIERAMHGEIFPLYVAGSGFVRHGVLEVKHRRSAGK